MLLQFWHTLTQSLIMVKFCQTIQFTINAITLTDSQATQNTERSRKVHIVKWRCLTAILTKPQASTVLNMPDSRENDQETDWAEKLPPPQHKQPTSQKLSLKCWWAKDTTCGHKVEDIRLPINHWRDAWTKVVVNGLNWKGKRWICGASTQILKLFCRLGEETWAFLGA